MKIWFQNHRYKLKKSRSSDEAYSVQASLPNFIAMRGNFAQENFKSMMTHTQQGSAMTSYQGYSTDYANQYPNFATTYANYANYSNQSATSSTYPGISQNPHQPLAVPGLNSWSYWGCLSQLTCIFCLYYVQPSPNDFSAFPWLQTFLSPPSAFLNYSLVNL